jgi:HKD family nuclease
MLDCTQLDIAMAYVKIGGLRTLVKNAKPLFERNVPIRIVFGLSSRQGITDKESAELLLKLSQKNALTVKKLNNGGFHPKMFIFHGPYPSVIVGSSNLTEAAQSTNAEANILVEDAEPSFIEAALEFFELHFNYAPSLERKHVSAYRAKSFETEGYVYGLSKEDKLLSPLKRKLDLQNLRPNTLWKIAPGANARYWPEWLKNIDEDGEGFIAIGWDEAGDLNGFKSYESLKDAVNRTAETIWDVNSDRKTNVKYAADQLWTFKTAFSSGDLIIVYSESRVLGLAQITPESQYLYRQVPTISYGYQMNVKYLWYTKWPMRADDRIVNTLGKQGTLKRIDENSLWDYLIKTLP